jgi:hypothetical protein
MIDGSPGVAEINECSTAVSRTTFFLKLTSAGRNVFLTRSL